MRHRPRAVLSGGLVAAVVVTLAAGPASAGQPPPAAPRAAPPGDPARSVTLITGDRVSVDRAGRASLVRGPGRAGIPVEATRVGGHLRVLPADAAPLVRAGRLDPRLFDVTALLGFGYDDRRAELPLIVVGSGGTGAARTTVAAGGARVVRELPAVGGLAVRAGRSGLGELWRAVAGGAAERWSLRGGVTRLWLDGLRKPILERSVPQIGAPAAWRAGLDGAGVTVAVLDTGVDAAHPDLAGRVTGRANFTEGEEDDRDLVGHGTHVASTIAGTGAASGGRYRGVAPGAHLLDAKVCIRPGCAESWLLAGMQWAAERGAAVVNMSLGAADAPGEDPVEEAVRTLTDRYGTLFVVAAGNEGADAAISSPASADAALAVGAVDGANRLADFSSRGPRVGDGGLKPDVTAPGVDITAARSADGAFGRPGERYVTLSGTSMAAPHVAGAAAILAQQHPRWRSGRLKAALMGSAEPTPALGVYAQGAGRVDVARAIGQSVAAEPTGLAFATQRWPHADDAPQTLTLGYRNDGAAPVTLAVAAEVIGPDGKPARTGMVTPGVSALTVPAGGAADLTVTVDTRVSGPDGRYTGRVVATAGSTRVQTPLAVEREIESYDVTIAHRTRAGAPADRYSTLLVPAAGTPGTAPYDAYDEDGTVTLRLPRGRYTLMSQLIEDAPGGFLRSLLAQPALDVTGATTVDADARRGRPVSVTVPRPDATALLAVVTAEVVAGGLTVVMDMLGEGFTGLYAGRIGGAAPLAGFASLVSGTWARLAADGSVDASPFTYHGAWYERGTMVDGFTRAVGPVELATVRSDYARGAEGTDVRGATLDFAVIDGLPPGGWAPLLPFPTPFERVAYFAGDRGVRWDRELDEIVLDATGPPSTLSVTTAPATAYPAGSATRESWNRGAFGPSLADPGWPEAWASRTGDTLQIGPPLFGDGADRPGSAAVASATTTLYRDGERIAQRDGVGGEFAVPAEPASYRVEISVLRDKAFPLSTRVDAEWTFRSGGTTTGPQRLPMSTVLFSPALDLHNAAPAGRAYPVPVSVHRQPGSPAAPNRSLTVEASYDEGRTWRRVPVVAGLVLLHHPSGAGLVSLRASATDRAGNTVRETMLRAYRIVN